MKVLSVPPLQQRDFLRNSKGSEAIVIDRKAFQPPGAIMGAAAGKVNATNILIGVRETAPLTL